MMTIGIQANSTKRAAREPRKVATTVATTMLMTAIKASTLAAWYSVLYVLSGATTRVTKQAAMP